MYKASLVLTAAAFCGVATGQAPAYSTASIVNASNYAPGPFAPGSVLSIFGTNLAFSTQGLTADNIAANSLPVELANIAVYFDGEPAPMLYASPGQVNFIIPNTEVAGTSNVRVVRQGLSGPSVQVQLVNSAPNLFPSSDGFAAATDYNAANALVTAAAPAHPNDLIVLYLTGLGRTQSPPGSGEIPTHPGLILNFSSLQVLLDGKAVTQSFIFYAGLTPGYAGLYQINFYLPGDCGTNPQIQVSVDGQTSPTGVQLAVQKVNN